MLFLLGYNKNLVGREKGSRWGEGGGGDDHIFSWWGGGGDSPLLPSVEKNPAHTKKNF